MMIIGKCPECGSNVIVKRDSPDGFYMGYSVTCASYRKSDGVHKKKRSFYNLDSVEEAKEIWEKNK